MKTFNEWLVENNSVKIEDTFNYLKFKDTLYLFRGVGGDKPVRTDFVGHWWTSNPYYAIPFGNSTIGRIWVSQITKQELQSLYENKQVFAKSIDDYPNYGFLKNPPNVRPVTHEEVIKLKQISGDVDKDGNFVTKSIPGLVKHLNGQKAIDAAYAVFDI